MKFYHFCGHPVWSDDHNAILTRVHNRHFAFYETQHGKVIFACPNCGAVLRVAYAYGDLRSAFDLAPDIGKSLRAWQKARRKLQRAGKLVPRDPDRVSTYGSPYLLPKAEDADPV
ncbi:MAG: hypothetical protein HGA45_41580 [Chloroflexales bacterium]|nr:hypothetical protein [Chloroflexales bacterium]